MSKARLHVIDDLVWFGIGGGGVSCANTDPETFVNSGKLDNLKNVYVVGFPDNAALVAALHERYSESSVSVWLGTPMPFLHSAIDSADSILDNIDILKSLPPSLGGWHKCVDLDYKTALLQCSLMELTDIEWTDELWNQHPLAKKLSFIYGLDNYVTSKLMCLVGDPRWFIDVDKPNKIRKLLAYLGLKYSNLEKVHDKSFEDIASYSKGANRCWIAVNSWTGGLGYDDASAADPSCFLWAKAKSTRNELLGIHKATKLFISFLVDIWLDEASSSELFVPKYFFEKCYDEAIDVTKTIESFEKHMQLR